MSKPENPSRRIVLQRVALGLSVGTLSLAEAPAVRGADPPLLREQDPDAREVHYVEDASRAPGAQSGANCSNCSIYTAAGDTQGSCTLFKGKLVKAAGWCNAWSGL
jgi:hypothetical protein